jgi:AraC-like DNA-binding protein
MADVTDAINKVARRSRDVTASRPESRRVLDPVASEVLVRVAHEMRQPLSAVSAAINVIKDDSDPSRREYACHVLERQCTRLSQLVEDLLVVARTGNITDRSTDIVVTLSGADAPAGPPTSEPGRPNQTSAAQEHVRRMLDRIEQSYSEPITLRSLAAELHRQSAYLGGMFRRMVGMSVHQWLTTVRLDRASTLIRDGVKVEAVSLLVGYRSKKNFYRQFKRRFGTTPFEHRHARRIES